MDSVIVSIIGITIQTVTFIGGGFLFAGKMTNEISNINSNVKTMNKEIDGIQAEIKKFGEVLTSMAVANVRIDNLEQDMRDLKSRCSHIHEFNRTAD